MCRRMDALLQLRVPPSDFSPPSDSGLVTIVLIHLSCSSLRGGRPFTPDGVECTALRVTGSATRQPPKQQRCNRVTPQPRWFPARRSPSRPPLAASRSPLAFPPAARRLPL